MWIQLLVMVVVMVLQAILSPKPPGPDPAQAAGLDEFDLPIASEAAPIPVLFGTRWLDRPNVVWYGDLLQEPIMSKPTGKK